MLVLKLELHDARTGDVRQIGTLKLVNTGEGTAERGEYRASLDYTLQNGKPDETRYTTITGFPRQRKTGWELAYHALQYILGRDNPAFTYADRELYIKRKGKYIQVGQFEGFPASGVFLVYKEIAPKRSWTGYEYIGDIPREDALTYARARVHAERACRKLTELREKTFQKAFTSEHRETGTPLPPEIAALVQDYFVHSAFPSTAETVNAVLDAIAEGEKEASLES